MWIGALLTIFAVYMDSVLIILQLVGHNVIVICIIGDNSAKVRNVPHSTKPFSKIAYIL